MTKHFPVEALPVGTIVDFHVGSWMHGTEVEITGITCNGMDSYLFSFNRGPNVVCESEYSSANIAYITKIHKRGKGPVYHVSQPNRTETNFEWIPLYQRKGYVSEYEVERFIWEELSRYGQNGTTFSQAIIRAILDTLHSRQIDLCNWYKTKSVKRWIKQNVNRFRISTATDRHYEMLLDDYGYCIYGDGLDDEFKGNYGIREVFCDIEKHISEMLYRSKRYNWKIRGVLNRYWTGESKGQIYRHSYLHGDKTYFLMSDVPESLIPEGYGDYHFNCNEVSKVNAIDFFHIEQLGPGIISIKDGKQFVKMLVDPNLLVESTELDYDPLGGEYGYGELDYM